MSLGDRCHQHVNNRSKTCCNQSRPTEWPAAGDITGKKQTNKNMHSVLSVEQKVLQEAINQKI